MEKFPGICELKIDFEADVATIVGRNGASKTSILDALGIMMQLVRAHLDGPRRNRVASPRSDLDIRTDAASYALILELKLRMVYRA